MYLSTEANTGGTPRVTALSINGVTISPNQQYVNTGISINGTSGQTTNVSITVQKDNTTSTAIAVSLVSSNVRNNSISSGANVTLNSNSGNETFTLQFTGNGTNTVSGNTYSTTIGITEINLTATPSGGTAQTFNNIRFTNASS